MHNKPIATIHLDRKNTDGVLYLSSKDLPGLWLWGQDPEQVFKDVKPTIEKLYQYNEGLAVEIKEVCQSNILTRWFSGDKECDTFEVYYKASISKDVSDGRLAVE